jgi:hypothetical protein
MIRKSNISISMYKIKFSSVVGAFAIISLLFLFPSCNYRKAKTSVPTSINIFEYKECFNGFWEDSSGFVNLLFVNDSTVITYSVRDSLNKRVNKLESISDVTLSFPETYYFWRKGNNFYSFDYLTHNWIIKKFSCDSLVIQDNYNKEIFYQKSEDQITPVFLRNLDTFVTIKSLK